MFQVWIQFVCLPLVFQRSSFNLLQFFHQRLFRTIVNHWFFNGLLLILFWWIFRIIPRNISWPELKNPFPYQQSLLPTLNKSPKWWQGRLSEESSFLWLFNWMHVALNWNLVSERVLFFNKEAFADSFQLNLQFLWIYSHDFLDIEIVQFCDRSIRRHTL